MNNPKYLMRIELLLSDRRADDHRRELATRCAGWSQPEASQSRIWCMPLGGVSCITWGDGGYASLGQMIDTAAD